MRSYREEYAIEARFDQGTNVELEMSANLMTATEELKVMESAVDIEKDDGAIQALSDKLKVPALKVIEVYRTEFKRLAAQSRIDTYLGVLALRNTKYILREACTTDPS